MRQLIATSVLVSLLLGSMPRRIEKGVLYLGNVQLTIDPGDPNGARGDLFHAANDAHRVSMFRKALTPAPS